MRTTNFSMRNTTITILQVSYVPDMGNLLYPDQLLTTIRTLNSEFPDRPGNSSGNPFPANVEL